MVPAAANPLRRLWSLLIIGGFLLAHSALAQLSSSIDVPIGFQLDRELAARLRPELVSASEEPKGMYSVGTDILRGLAQNVVPADHPDSFSWDLRITKEPGEGNAFSSPDGTIYVDRSLALTLGSRRGLWAAALAHEIAHIVRRDWARRYLYEKSLRDESGSVLGLGDAAGSSGVWRDAADTAHKTSQFSQTMEAEADAYGLMLMARAGYHPDFMFLLQNLLHAREPKRLEDPLHPRWSSREAMLRKEYGAAGREYERLWPEAYASPGGNPPLLVSTGELKASQRRDAIEIRVPLQCSNLSGAVEVVLQMRGADNSAAEGTPPEWRQITGCTSDKTWITFLVATDTRPMHGHAVADISIRDDDGALLARSDQVKLGQF